MSHLAFVVFLVVCGAVVVTGHTYSSSFVGPGATVKGGIKDVFVTGMTVNLPSSSSEKEKEKEKEPEKVKMEEKGRPAKSSDIDEEVFNVEFDSEGCATINDEKHCGRRIALYRVHVDGRPVPPAGPIVPGEFNARRLSVALEGPCKTLIVKDGYVDASDVTYASIEKGHMEVRGNVLQNAHVEQGKLNIGGNVLGKARVDQGDLNIESNMKCAARDDGKDERGGKTEIIGVAEGAHVGSMNNVRVAEVINEGGDKDSANEMLEALKGATIKVVGVAEGGNVKKIVGMDVAGVRMNVHR